MIQSSLFAAPSRGAPDEGLPVAPSYESVGRATGIARTLAAI
jgi:hypothetical protein